MYNHTICYLLIDIFKHINFMFNMSIYMKNIRNEIKSKKKNIYKFENQQHQLILKFKCSMLFTIFSHNK